MENRLPINQTGTPLERHTPDLTITQLARQWPHNLVAANGGYAAIVLVAGIPQKVADTRLDLDPWKNISGHRKINQLPDALISQHGFAKLAQPQSRGHPARGNRSEERRVGHDGV